MGEYAPKIEEIINNNGKILEKIKVLQQQEMEKLKDNNYCPDNNIMGFLALDPSTLKAVDILAFSKFLEFEEIVQHNNLDEESLAAWKEEFEDIYKEAENAKPKLVKKSEDEVVIDNRSIHESRFFSVPLEGYINKRLLEIFMKIDLNKSRNRND